MKKICIESSSVEIIQSVEIQSVEIQPVEIQPVEIQPVKRFSQWRFFTLTNQKRFANVVMQGCRLQMHSKLEGPS